MYNPQLVFGFEHDYGTHTGLQLNPDYVTYAGAAFDPKDYNIFYHQSVKVLPKDDDFVDYNSVLKWTFIPNGEAILDSDWFGFDTFLWDGADDNSRDACIAADDYIYI